MPGRFFRSLSLLLLPTALLAGGAVTAAPDAAPFAPLPGFQTVEGAITATVRAPEKVQAGRSGYLGVCVAPDPKGRLLASLVEAGSPAATAGIEAGDELQRVDGRSPRTAEALRQVLLGHAAGDSLKLRVARKGKSRDLEVTLAAVSRPRDAAGPRPVLGVQTGEWANGIIPISRVLTSSPAEKAGIKQGDGIVRVDDRPLPPGAGLADLFDDKKPGDPVRLLVVRDGQQHEVTAQLGSENPPDANAPAALPNAWRKPAYRIAVIGVEYPDTPHNAQIAVKDWEEAFFSQGSYHDRASVTGQPVYGSMNDYYQEISAGAFHVEGHMFDWVPVSNPRADYSQAVGANARDALLVEATDALLKREGADALKEYDGVFFIYAGARFPTNRGGLYWPHRSSFNDHGKRWPYFICPEGGRTMTSISVFCHEFGHMLGLPDLYARPENPGSTGLGVWCAMSNEAGNGRPQHFSAWCKEQLGWLHPAVIDPGVPQKLVLGAVEGSARECYKVLVRPDGSEYLLLENRRKSGFDQSLPAEGLLVWRVVGNHPILEESHGVDGPAGPRVFLSAVPYPSTSNNAFTPFTTPSSRSQLGGGLPVYLTNITRLPDGRISFYIGYEFE